MNRRGFVGAIVALLAAETTKASPNVLTLHRRTESLEETRALMCVSIRTDPDVARDQAIFVDQWRRELGRIINLGSDSPSGHGAGVVRRERPPPGSGGHC